MTVQLGNVTLDSRLLLRGTFQSPQIVTKVERTLTGVRVPIIRPAQGRELELTTEAPNGVKAGLLTRAQLDAIATIRDLGQIVNLTYHSTVYRVFLPDDCIQVSSITESQVSNSANKFVGSIRLIEV